MRCVGGLRIVLQPKLIPVEAGLGVLGADVRLEHLGPDSTVDAAADQPATLRFLVAYLDRALPTAQPSFEEFASLVVQLGADETGAPIITLDAESDFAYKTPEPSPPQLARAYELSFDPKSFAGVPADDEHPLKRLRLPADPENKRFGEIAVELEVGGAIVAPHLNNDRLDIPLRNYVDLLLLDGEDLPMSGERYAVVLGGREVSSGRLDENGAARLVELPSVRCRITFPDLEPQTDLRRLTIEDVPEELR